jgi:hypothetical protein
MKQILLSIVLFILLHLDNATASSSGVRSDKKKHSAENKGSNCPVFTKNPDGNEELSKRMLAATKPCGHYKKAGCTYEVIPADIVHPGDGPGELQYKPYIVQFDVGVHPKLRTKVLKDHKKWSNADRGRDCIGCENKGEECLELIVKGGSDATGGCAGKCGSGCVGAGYAKDCMKHDVCASYKALVQLKEHDWTFDDGFCYDPDCGDEAAQTLHNCYLSKWGSDTPITCEEDNFYNEKAYGHWSTATNVFGGPCFNFISWNRGQGLPDKKRISNPYEFLAHLKKKGVDVSGAYDLEE